MPTYHKIVGAYSALADAVLAISELTWQAFKLLAVRVVLCMILSVGLVLLGVHEGKPLVELALLVPFPWAFLIGIPAVTAWRIRT